MVVKIEMGNLSEIIEKSLNDNINSVVEESVSNIVKGIINDKFKETIESEAENKIKSCIDNYINNKKFNVGDVFSETKEYTVIEYMNEKISKALERQKFTTKQKNYYGNMETSEVSFEDYIKSKVNISGDITKYLDNFCEKAKKDITRQINEVFNDSTRKVLSETVFDMLMKTDTYRSITESLNTLGMNK